MKQVRPSPGGKIHDCVQMDPTSCTGANCSRSSPFVEYSEVGFRSRLLQTHDIRRDSAAKAPSGSAGLQEVRFWIRFPARDARITHVTYILLSESGARPCCTEVTRARNQKAICQRLKYLQEGLSSMWSPKTVGRVCKARGRFKVPRLANFFWYLAYEVPAHSDVLSIRLPSRIHKEVYFREMLLGRPDL